MSEFQSYISHLPTSAIQHQDQSAAANMLCLDGASVLNLLWVNNPEEGLGVLNNDVHGVSIAQVLSSAAYWQNLFKESRHTNTTTQTDIVISDFVRLIFHILFIRKLDTPQFCEAVLHLIHGVAMNEIDMRFSKFLGDLELLFPSNDDSTSGYLDVDSFSNHIKELKELRKQEKSSEVAAFFKGTSSFNKYEQLKNERIYFEVEKKGRMVSTEKHAADLFALERKFSEELRQIRSEMKNNASHKDGEEPKK